MDLFGLISFEAIVKFLIMILENFDKLNFKILNRQIIDSYDS